MGLVIYVALGIFVRDICCHQLSLTFYVMGMVDELEKAQSFKDCDRGWCIELFASLCVVLANTGLNNCES